MMRDDVSANVAESGRDGGYHVRRVGMLAA